jgi:hypothetical protein
MGITSTEAGKLLSRLLRDTAKETMGAEKLNCAEDLTSNNMFKSIALNQQKVLRETLAKDKKVNEWSEQKSMH